jgi:hypothetical protein
LVHAALAIVHGKMVGRKLVQLCDVLDIAL